MGVYADRFVCHSVRKKDGEKKSHARVFAYTHRPL